MIMTSKNLPFLALLLMTVPCMRGEGSAPVATPSPVSTPRPARPKPRPAHLPAEAFMIGSYHPASCGWLVDWSRERNFCANNYLDHLDRVKADPSYVLALSEVNNMMAIRNFKPERFEEMKGLVKQGRVEPVNAFFLEPTVSLSGGEALARIGVEGIRWQEKMLGIRPRHCWAIDTCGVHDQMPQLCGQLGLDALVYVRCSPSPDSTVYWSESPDGTRLMTLAASSGYAEDIAGLFSTKEPVTTNALSRMVGTLTAKAGKLPEGVPPFVLAGRHDYSPPPVRKENPGEFLGAWKAAHPECPVRFSTLSEYLAKLLPGISEGRLKVPSVQAGSRYYAYNAFWVNAPKVKQWFRRDEHLLQASEMAATAASLRGNYAYPSKTLRDAWLQLFLNMDRNTLWGAAIGSVFEDSSSWDARDRFEWIGNHAGEILASSSRSLTGQGSGVALFNPVNRPRTSPFRIGLPPGKTLAGAVCEDAGDGTQFVARELPSCGITGAELAESPAPVPKEVPLPGVIETDHYSATVDPVSGDLTSLKTKPSGRELLGGAANVLVADQGERAWCDGIPVRAKRKRVTGQAFVPTRVVAREGALGWTVESEGSFVGKSKARRILRFFRHDARIDCETELTNIPDKTLVSAEFPLAGKPAEIRRGIPFGFSRDDSRVTGIVPAIRWSDYSTPGLGGLALLDRGLPGREIEGGLLLFPLLNAQDHYHGYPADWISGKGTRRLEYSLVPHDADWEQAGIPGIAWEYNSPVAVTPDCGSANAGSFVETSPNLILEAMRREGGEIELRLSECLGKAGKGRVTLHLPHGEGRLTDFLGEHPAKLEGGPGTYGFEVRPQQIVTLRFNAPGKVEEPPVLTRWDELVPEAKRRALNSYDPTLLGHPNPKHQYP